MAKSKKTEPAYRKTPQRTPRPAPVVAGPSPHAALPPFFSNIRLQGLLIFAFAFLLYVNTFGHQFTLDDSIVITDNMFTKEGIRSICQGVNRDSGRFGIKSPIA